MYSKSRCALLPYFLIDAFNDYVSLTGVRNNRLVAIGDDTPLLHLLSYSDDKEQGNDLLYRIIVDVVRQQPEAFCTSVCSGARVCDRLM